MHALVRTRSQHFVSSPRKTATPFRHKRNAPKRRRITVTTFESDAITADSGSDDPGPSRERSVLSAETGEQTANQLHSRRKGKAVEKRPTLDVFASGDDSSPRKRKRDEEAPTSGSGSWVEMSEDEGEPDLIADSDHFLLHDAPSTTLHRLKKAELVRLWKVAGMWDDDADEDTVMEDEEMDKKQLVDGLVAARSPRSSPKRKAAIDASYEIKRLRSATGVIPPSSSENWPQATPMPRRRARITDVRPRRTPGPGTAKVKTRAKHRSKSMGDPDRRARFGDDVKSPAHALKRNPVDGRTRTRRSSTLSSVYTTTDASPDDSPITIRGRPKRVSRGFTPRRPKRLGPLRRTSIIEILDSSDESDIEPTPLVARLRSRSTRVVSADHSDHEADVEDEESPQPRRQLRSRDRNIALPERGAKIRAMEALKDAESDTESSVDAMSVDDEVDRRPLTRAQLRAAANNEGAFAPRHNRKDSHLSLDLTEMALSDDDEVGSMAPYSSGTVTADEVEMDGVTRTTRSGKAFGVWQSRKLRLRQEAIDDPDMEVEEEDEEDGEEEEEEFEDIDLSEATLSSLVRLLRDELVQLCEARGLEVGGTKPQLAKSLLHWYAEQNDTISTTSSQATARPRSSRARGKIIHAVASNVHVSGKTTPVLLRDHIHATDPQTPPHSDEARRGDTDLNLDLQELGLEDSMIKPEQLQKLERIGSGGFKDVYVGKFRGRKVAISEFRSHLSDMDIRELKLLAEFSHPNIVKFKGICIPEDSTLVPCMLVSELCENGDLFDYIRNVEPQSFRRVVGLMLDIARGLEYLHTRKPAIIHRDCKSSNILINRSLQAKVGDFGLARVKTSTRSMIRSLVGTVNWQAPELWHPHPRYDYKVDVFSAGMVYWEMLSGWTGDQKYPWEGHNEHYIYDAVGSKQRRPPVTGLRKHWGPEVVDLMERMWSQEPGDRPSMTTVVKELEELFYASTFTPLKHH